MDKHNASNLIRETLENSFDKERFLRFTKELLNTFDESKAFERLQGAYIAEKYREKVKAYERLGTYTGPDGKKIDILIVYLRKEGSIERARTSLRNFASDYLRQRDEKDAGLIAYVSPNQEDWRFSFVKMEYKFTETAKGTQKVKEEFTPVKRYSFLVGTHESSHTAQSWLLPILQDDAQNPTLVEIENAFNVERVTKEFFEKYRNLFLWLKESLDAVVKNDIKIRADFKEKNIDTADFCKKLLGQIVFLYFLQKKGWFGVKRREEWGSGSKHFLRELFEKKHGDYKNFFNDILEPLFYEALRLERSGDYYSRFNCRIPFLNGGLFDPLADYDWWETDILLHNELFSNGNKTKEGDTGDGILDIFDRYNFTVKEDEPLEKEVAVDPEMLGKVFENLLEVKDRKSKGTYYTPREIVHYMCQESLANYLATELSSSVIARSGATRQSLPTKEDIEKLIKYGETVVEHDSRVASEGRETERYSFKLPQSVRKHAKLIDEKLASIRVCDPAVGSGAFPVGMMNEIVRTRNALTPYINSSAVIAGEAKQSRTPYHFKREAIQNCLYGVDIDPGAVEITKLRLWLSLVVDEEERETIQPLPNLDYKIMQGNSLISEFMGVDFDKDSNEVNGQLSISQDKTDEFIQKLKAKKDEYLSRAAFGEKQKLRQEIEDLMIKIFETKLQKQRTNYFLKIKSIEHKYENLPNKEQRDSQIQTEKEKIYETEGFNIEEFEQRLREYTTGNKIRPFFPWRLYFAEVFYEKEGFDVVIANPPYGFRNILSAEEKKYFRKEKGIQFPSGDIAELFVLMSYNNLVRSKGVQTFIIPKKSLYGESWSNVRKLWLENDLIYLMDASNAFEKVLLEQTSFSLMKTSSQYNSITVGGLDQENDCIQIFGTFSAKEIFSKDLRNTQIYRGLYPQSLLNKILNSSIEDTLQYVRGEIGISNITSVLTLEPKRNYPCVKGIDIIRYGLKQERFLKGSVAKKYITQYTEDKIVAQEIIAHVQNPFPHIIITMFYDDTKRLFNDTCVEVKTLNAGLSKKFLLAYYQSSLCSWYAYNMIYNRAIRTMHFINYYITQMPLPKAILEDTAQQKPFIAFVDKILVITKNDDYLENPAKQAKVREYEKQIDQLVYKLYGLTAEEIKIVENGK